MAKIEEIMRGCLKNMDEHKTTEVADYFANDGLLTTPFGKFVGKEEITRFLIWRNKKMSWTTVSAGNDIISSGKKAFSEHRITATIKGKSAQFTAMCAWEFDDNDKVKKVKTVYDLSNIHRLLNYRVPVLWGSSD